MSQQPYESMESLLRAAREGDTAAANALFDQLRNGLMQRVRRRRFRASWRASDLVQDALLKLLKAGSLALAADTQFLHIMASRVIMEVWVDHQRTARAKRAGELYDDRCADLESSKTNRDDVREALSLLERDHPRQAQVILLHRFGGYTQREISGILEVSLRTVEDDERFAKAWLKAKLRP